MTELTNVDHRQLVARLYDLHARLADITEQMNAVKMRLRSQLAADEYTIDGKKAVTISRQRRFDVATAERILPPELLALCRVEKVDAATAKTVLPPALYSQCSTESGEPVIRLA